MTQAREEEVGSLVERLRGVRFAGQHYGVPGMCHEGADEIERLQADRKRDCVEFFRWFWNQPGTNAEQGYDAWREALNKEQADDDQV